MQSVASASGDPSSASCSIALARFSGGPYFWSSFWRSFSSAPRARSSFEAKRSKSPIGPALLQRDGCPRILLVEGLQGARRLLEILARLGQHDLHDGVHVPTCSPAEVRQPLAAQPDLLAALRSRGDAEADRPLEGGQRDLRAIDRLGDGDGEVQEEVPPFTAHERVLGEPNLEEEIAGLAAVATGPSLAGEPDLRAVRDARRDLHPERLPLDPELPLPAEHRLAQRDLQLGLGVGAVGREGASSPPPGRLAEEIAEDAREVEVPHPAHVDDRSEGT